MLKKKVYTKLILKQLQISLVKKMLKKIKVIISAYEVLKLSVRDIRSTHLYFGNISQLPKIRANCQIFIKAMDMVYNIEVTKSIEVYQKYGLLKIREIKIA